MFPPHHSFLFDLMRKICFLFASIFFACVYAISVAQVFVDIPFFYLQLKPVVSLAFELP